MNEVIDEASYCLNCKTRPCSVKGCPIHTEIPEFIEEIKKQNYKKAYDILQSNNVCSYICSLICPQEEQCEGSCIRGIKSVSTHIGKLERFVNEWAIKNNYEYEYKISEKNGKKVAIIGSGPAGLECAMELLKSGFTVDIFEKDPIPGGILVYGIPDFRLSKEHVKSVIDKIRKLGANFYTNKELGKDFFLKDISKKYDAVFLGIGAPKSTTYPLCKNKLDKIYTSEYFLKEYSEGRNIKDLGTVAVIGGGNVAMDSARVAVKMGAKKVKILYRRNRELMPARKIELEDALKAGVQFKELTRVVSVNEKNGKIESLNCVRTKIADGIAKDVEPIQAFIEEANSVIFAIGLKPDKSLIESQNIELDDKGYIKIDENGKTNLKNVYAGGDNTESRATVCVALAAGRRAARGIKSKLL